jgi:hypothetical protein
MQQSIADEDSLSQDAEGIATSLPRIPSNGAAGGSFNPRQPVVAER